jgi:putative ABC transport system permease protein
MFIHLMKPIWKRKFKNLLLSLEIFLAFIVVFGLALVSVRFYQLYHLPTGFEYQDVWSIQVSKPGVKAGSSETEITESMTRSLSALPEVEQLSFVGHSPYTSSTWVTGLYLPESGRVYQADMMEMSDSTFLTLNVKLVEGAAFSDKDEGATQGAVVINRKLAEQMFPGQSAIGKIILNNDPTKKEEKVSEEGGPTSKDMRVSGVVEDFRNKGEFMAPTNFILQRHSTVSNKKMLNVILLKLKPGTSRIFEAKLIQQLKMIRSDWAYTINPMSELRKSKLTEDTIPLMILAVIASFLLVMVGFGLFGVLWQNTTQRIPEIGLRRAVGADSGHIYRQIITEQLMLSSLAVFVGVILLIQIPITGFLGEFANWTVFATALFMAIGIIYLMSLLCSLYPAWRASRLSPTEALHYE